MNRENHFRLENYESEGGRRDPQKFENFVVLRGNAAFFKKLSQIRKQALVKIVGAIFALLVILGVWHHSSSNSKHHKKHHKKVTHTQEVNSKLKLSKYFPAILDIISLRLFSKKSSIVGNLKSDKHSILRPHV